VSTACAAAGAAAPGGADGPPPRGVFVVHGEPDAADALRLRIEHELDWPARVPELGDEVELD